jgi:hypothetical protein
MGWVLLAGAKPIADPVGSFKYVVFNNPSWDWTTLNFDGDVAALEKPSSRRWIRTSRI